MGPSYDQKFGSCDWSAPHRFTGSPSTCSRELFEKNKII